MNERRIDYLIVRVAQGDNAAFEQLYFQTKCGVYSFVYSYMGNRADAEDVMQNTYLKIKLNADKYTAGTNGRAWILQIAKNLALNELSKRRRAESGGDGEAEAQSDFPAGSVNDLMQRELSEEERRIVTLHVLWGYKHREIARMLGCPTGTVTSKYKRSVEKLKKALKEAEE